MTMEQYLEDEGQTVEEFEADLERRVRDAVAAQFVLDEVAKKEEIGVDAGRAHRAPGAPRPAVRPGPAGVHPTTCSSTTTSPSWSPRSVRGKALAHDRGGARPSPTRPATRVELKNLRPDGTIGDPAEAEAAASAEPTTPTRGAADEPRRRPTPERPAPSDDPCHRRGTGR